MWSEFTTPKIPFAHFVSCLFVQARSVNLEITMDATDVSDATRRLIEEVAEGVPDDKIHDYSRYADEPGLIPDSTENIHSEESLSLFSIYRVFVLANRNTSQQGDYKYVRYKKETKEDAAPEKIRHASPNQQNLKNGKVFVAFPENINNKGEAMEKKQKDQYYLIGEASYQRYIQVLKGTYTSKLDRERHLKRSYVEKSFASSGNKKTKNSKDKHEAKKVSEQEAYEIDLEVLDQNRCKALVDSSAAHKRTPPTSGSVVLALEGLDENRHELSHAHLNAGREHKAYETFIRSARTGKALISAVVDCKIEDLEKYIKLNIRLTEDLVQYCLLCIEKISNREDPMHHKYREILDLLLRNVDLEGKEPSVIFQKWRALCPDFEDVQTILKWHEVESRTDENFKEAEEAVIEKLREEEQQLLGKCIQRSETNLRDLKLKIQQARQRRQQAEEAEEEQLQQAEKARGTMFPGERVSRMITFHRELLDIVRGPGVLKR